MRRLQNWFSKVGIGVPYLEIWPQTTTPTHVGHIRPTSAPSGTAAKGDYYVNSSTGSLYVHDGTAFRQIVGVGGSAGTGVAAFDDITVADDATIGDDLTLSSDGAVISIGATPAVITHSANTLTLATGDTFAVTDADKLVVNSVIVPTIMQLCARVGPHATVTEYDLMVAPRALQVTRIDVVPSTLQGGALTATICKATGTSAPANGTTPMHTANAINLNTGAYTVQNITLTATTADLQLAAGDRIGIDYSAALTAGHAAVTISYKYI